VTVVAAGAISDEANQSGKETETTTAGTNEHCRHRWATTGAVWVTKTVRKQDSFVRVSVRASRTGSPPSAQKHGLDAVQVEFEEVEEQQHTASVQLVVADRVV